MMCYLTFVIVADTHDPKDGESLFSWVCISSERPGLGHLTSEFTFFPLRLDPTFSTGTDKLPLFSRSGSISKIQILLLLSEFL